MNRNYLLLRLFGISACCLVGIFAREAIVGGYKAGPLDSRYQATILIADHAPRCGGGIIGERFVLTAAHCVIAINDGLIGRLTSVLVGTNDLSVAGVVVQVEKIFVPKEYNPRISHSVGDIAVLKLKQPLEIVKNELKQLSGPQYKASSYLENRTVRIAGFGWDEMFEYELIGEHSDHRLRIADAVVRTDTECKYDHPIVNLTEKHLCARVKQDFQHVPRSSGVCIGDGGGPLVLGGKTVIGILSETTLDCSEGKSSGIYTRVSHYVEFILYAKENMKSSMMRVLKV